MRLSRTPRRLPAARAEKHAQQDTGGQKLNRSAHAPAAVPAVQAMAGEELAPAGAREGKDVLEVRSRRRERPGDGGIEGSTHRGEGQDGGDPGADLEAAVDDVLVRHQVAREMKQQAKWNRPEPRADEGATRRAGRDV